VLTIFALPLLAAVATDFMTRVAPESPRLVSESGYAALLVNVDEIKELVREPAPDAATVHELVARLETSAAVIKALIASGHFTTVTVRNPINRCPMRAIPNADVAAFMKEFVPLFELSAQCGVHFRALNNLIKKQGVLPALDPKQFHATFYRRADIQRIDLPTRRGASK